MSENKATQLLKEFADWYESIADDDLSNYDQDTTPFAVWDFLTHCDDSLPPNQAPDADTKSSGD